MKKYFSILLSIVIVIAPLYIPVYATGTGVVSVELGEDVTEYSSITEAFANLPANEKAKITLLKTVALDNDETLEISSAGADVVFNLNGYTLTGNGTTVIGVGEGAALTLTDSVGTGCIINNTPIDTYTVLFTTGTLIIESGSYKAENGTVIQTLGRNANVTVSGGRFETKSMYSLELLSGNAQISGGVFDGVVHFGSDNNLFKTTATGKITGGEFLNGISTTGAGYVIDFIAENYGLFTADNTEVLVSELQDSYINYCTVQETTVTERPYQAKLILSDGTEQYYVLFTEAFYKARQNKGSVLCLLDNIELSSALTMPVDIKDKKPKEFTIDLKGFSITESDSYSGEETEALIMIDTYTTLTLKDSVGGGGIISSTEYGTVTNRGELTVDNIILENHYVDEDWFTVVIENDGVLDINYAVVTNSAEKGYGVYNDATGDAVIYGGIYTADRTVMAYSYNKLKLGGGEYIGTFREQCAEKLLVEGCCYYDKNNTSITEFEGDTRDLNAEYVKVNCVYPIVNLSVRNTKIDYESKKIYTNNSAQTDFDKLIKIIEGNPLGRPSYVYGNYELYGTGSEIQVETKTKKVEIYTLVVQGDVNGDSVVDVLDAVEVQRAVTNHTELTDIYLLAADTNFDSQIDANDYSKVVNLFLNAD